MTQVSTGRKSADAVDGANGRLLRIDEVADFLSLSKSMVWKAIAQGQLRSLRFGRAVRVRPADLEAYIESSVRET